MGIDEREDPDDEIETTVEGMPFVASNEVIDSYGSVFKIAVDEGGMPRITAG